MACEAMDRTPNELSLLSAGDAAAGIRDGYFTSEDLVRACLLTIDQREPKVQAWTYLDPEHALNQARRADEARAAGAATGPLHGVPVGIKDIIDTRDMPTEDGTVLHSGRRPLDDAAVVSRLRAAGAVIMGKTVTTEFATYAPGKTRNPQDPTRSPGGSSSGSAAAVAAGMVPLAIGTQTNGSIIRPASFCGVVGFKPSFGSISRRGVLRTSRSLDQVGVIARNVADAALLAQALFGHDPEDPDTAPTACPPLVRVCAEDPPLAPTIGLVRTPFWDQLDEPVREGLDELAELLGGRCGELPLPESAVWALDWHRQVMEAEMAANLAEDFARGADAMSESLRAQLTRGREIRAVDYLDAKARMPLVRDALDEAFEHCHALLAPATFGSAPADLSSTGDPRLCTLWSYCGLPAISLPLLADDQRMPIGVQLVGRLGDDARLLRTARWLVDKVVAAASTN
jgi:Asp-tRNA(Asn)/Glu-tRNA(Gln) amidotransferase A subunit family amidase